MGRETKILLGLLGMLACVFLGALVARLFVARPPVGLGVDIHANVAVVEPAAIVEPPELGRPDRSAFAAIASTDPSAMTEPEPIAIDGAKPIEEVSALESSAVLPAAAVVVPAAFEEPVDGPPAGGSAALDRVVRPGTNCTVVEGDTWWNLAEAAYGDGRWYRGLYAWNRAVDPGVSLRPGTSLVVPSAAELSAAYPGLVPARTSAGRVLP